MEKPRMFTFAGRVIKNLFKKPATTQYPFEPAAYPDRMRGHIRIEIENCITCGLCMRSCPSQAIRVDRKAGTWTIERFDCVQCGFCVATCPKKCLFMEKGYTEPDILKKEEAVALGAVGPMLRASGVEYDVRMLGYGAYKDLTVKPITSTDGDCYGRCEVRLKELFQSFDLIREAIGKIPSGDISVPVKGNPDGEYFMRIEQPRGEAIYYVKGNGTKYLDRFRLRTPTTSNIPPLVETLKGCQLADVPILILTIDPCVSCTER